MNELPRLVIAAPESGSGKSTIASGLMAAFARRFPVQGFKVGPDYIDPMYHSAATGRPSRNLDSWMLPADVVQRLFVRAASTASLSIIEGVMGLFDGYGSDPFDGSTAGTARLLQAPVVLVIDCGKMSGSAAALAYGFHTFSPLMRLAGVICNRVGGEQHARWLTDAIEAIGLPVLGCIPQLPELVVPERHLGLFTAGERQSATAVFLEQAAGTMQRYLDLDRLLEIARSAPPLETLPPVTARPAGMALSKVRVAVARDEAFCFYYEDNLDELRAAGAEIALFSPLRETQLPERAAGLYLGGGYPELYARELSENTPLMAQIRRYHQAGLPIYAECGGLMTLTEGIEQADGLRFPLVGALPGWCKMADRLTLGYREVEALGDNCLLKAGMKLRGHEFHYSGWENSQPEYAAYRVLSRQPGRTDLLSGYSKDNLMASYVHLHFAQDERLAQRFTDVCRRWGT